MFAIREDYEGGPKLITMEVFAHFSSRNLGFFKGSGWQDPACFAAGLLGHLGEAVTKGVNDEFKAVGDVELGKNRAEVVRNSRFTDE